MRQREGCNVHKTVSSRSHHQKWGQKCTRLNKVVAKSAFRNANGVFLNQVLCGKVVAKKHHTIEIVDATLPITCPIDVTIAAEVCR